MSLFDILFLLGYSWLSLLPLCQICITRCSLFTVELNMLLPLPSFTIDTFCCCFHVPCYNLFKRIAVYGKFMFAFVTYMLRQVAYYYATTLLCSAFAIMCSKQIL